MGQLGHLGPCDPNQPVAMRPGHSLGNHHQPLSGDAVWFGTGPTAAEAGRGGRGGGLVPLGLLPPAPRPQVWVSEPESLGQGGQELLAWPSSHVLAFPMARPGMLGRREGPGSQQPRVRISPLPEPAAGCHLGRGSASFPNLPSLWKRGRKLCAEKIASPSILRLKTQQNQPLQKRKRWEMLLTGLFPKEFASLGALTSTKNLYAPSTSPGSCISLRDNLSFF